jgi:hypothetical protein
MSAGLSLYKFAGFNGRWKGPHTVLVQAQSTTGMLNKQIQQANFVISNLGKIRNHLIGYQVGAPRFCGESKLLLEPSHCACSSVRISFRRGVQEGDEAEWERPNAVK